MVWFGWWAMLFLEILQSYRETQKPIDGLAPFASNESQGMMSKADWGILMLWQTLYQLNKHD